MKEQNVDWIDAMKGIAICGVVMIHCGGTALPSILGKIGGIGQNGVQLFFLISAYLSYASLDRYFHGNVNNMTMPELWKWWRKKYWKLIPLYYSMIVIYTIIVREGSTIGYEGHISPANLLFHFLFLHGFVPHYANSIIGGEWYLGDLAILYLIVPFLYKKIQSIEKAFIVFVMTSFLCCALNHLSQYYIPNSDTSVYTSYFGSFWIFMQLPVMMFGILLYFVLKSRIWTNIEQKKVISYLFHNP